MSENNFYTAAKPVLFVSRIFGLSPFLSKNNRVYVSKLLTYYTVGLIALLLTTFSYTTYIRSSNPMVFFKKTTDILQILSWTTFVCLTLTNTCINRKYLGVFLKLQNFDRKYGEIKTLILYTKIRNGQYLELAIKFACILIINIWQILNADTRLNATYAATIVTYSTPQIFGTIVCSVATFYVREIHRRFRLVNRNFENLLRLPQFSGKIRGLRRTCTMHQDLSMLVEEFNEAFGSVMVLSFGVAFITLTVGLYYCCLSFTVMKWKYIMVSFLVFATFFFDSVCICHVCHATTTTAQKTGQILHKIESPDNELKDEMEMFSFQIVSHSVEFNAAGYFPINYSLLFSVVSGATTHLIILLQLPVS